MALRHSQICSISPIQLTNIIQDKSRKVRVIDCRSFLEYNDNHIVGAVNICCSKLIKRRLQQEKIALKDLLFHCRIEAEETSDVVLYDQRSATAEDVPFDSFIYVLLKKLVLVFEKVYHLSGGFSSFHSVYPESCENKVWKFPGLSALSQPCLPTSAAGPTRILSFLYLGSEEDANNQDLLQTHNITYELNVSNKCPKPDFISDGHFMRIPVNDSHNEKLSNFFNQTFQFIEKVRGSNDCVLVHCLAGISRSPTVAIAYIMRHLQMTCEDAYRYVKAKRTTISPNFNFLGQLLEYERQLIGEKIVQKPQTQAAASSSTPASEFLFASQPIISPPPTTSGSKRFNLSLRLCPFSSSPGLTSPKDVSPTSAMARLQFDKPLGKENRTGTSAGSPPSTHPPSSPGFSLSRPTRLVKDQNVNSIQEEDGNAWESMTKAVMKQSLSISFSKGFKNRKSTIDHYQHQFESSAVSGCGKDDNNYTTKKKCRIHKIMVEGEPPPPPAPSEGERASSIVETSSVSAVPASLVESSSSADLLPSPLEQFKRDFVRSDSLVSGTSVSTSGIGSEISDHDLLTSGSWEMNESGSIPDDGVFSDTYGLYLKSPKSARQLQLWSSDSGHWSSADEGAVSASCSTSTIEVPSTSAATNIQDAKSPEKRKHSDKPSPRSRLNPANFEKRRSYAEATAGEWGSCESRPKRWSLAEPISDQAASFDAPPDSGKGFNSKWRGEDEVEETGEDWRASGGKKDCETDDSVSSSSNSSGGSHLNFGTQWFNLLSGREMSTNCDRSVRLYRVQSCPGMVGCRDWVELQNQVPESPPDEQLEPISDSVLLKIRSCRNRKEFGNAFLHPIPSSSCLKNRFSCGSIDYDELLYKLEGVHDDRKGDSTHSSSSTLASSSFSIAVQ